MPHHGDPRDHPEGPCGPRSSLPHRASLLLRGTRHAAHSVTAPDAKGHEAVRCQGWLFLRSHSLSRLKHVRLGLRLSEDFRLSERQQRVLADWSSSEGRDAELRRGVAAVILEEGACHVALWRGFRRLHGMHQRTRCQRGTVFSPRCGSLE